MLRIGLVDDHDLFRLSFKSFLNSKPEYSVIIDANNPDELFEILSNSNIRPDIIITDYYMPIKSGKLVIENVKKNHPEIKIVVLSVYKHDHLISELITDGAAGYISKGAHPSDLVKSLELIQEGYTVIIGQDNELKMFSTISHLSKNNKPSIKLSSRQKEFLKWCINTELTYKEIANKLNISPKTADRYRDDLFKKLNIKSRSGLLLYALEVGLYSI